MSSLTLYNLFFALGIQRWYCSRVVCLTSSFQAITTDMARKTAACDLNPTTSISSLPWCRKYLDDTSYEKITMQSRIIKPTSHDALFAQTFQTPSTINEWIALRKVGKSLPLEEWELCVLVYLGSGLDGWQGICHGGVTATLLDEVMSALTGYYNHEHGKLRSELTVELNVKFKKPMTTPHVYAVRARLLRVQGRKIWASSQVVNGSEEIVSHADGFFVMIDAKI